MKNLQLVLTSPCTEQWSNIEESDGRHYCERCKKNIIDLTDRSDEELIQFFKNKKDNVCGRVLGSQLNRELVLPASKPNWHWLLPLALGVVAVSPVEAQHLKPVVVHTDQPAGMRSNPVDSLLQSVESPLLNHIISGKVVDSLSNRPLPNVKIRKKGYENVLAITGSDGGFEFQVSDGDKLARFIFDLGDYASLETSVKSDMVIKLIVKRRIMVGGISTVSINQKPLYLLYSGRKSCTIDAEKMNELSPDWIEKIEVLNGSKATAIYGVKGANGVVLIGIKKAYAKKINFSKR
ncbi:hypothetical protein [Pedobacter rhizosphaerae]|uniref:hypothetical protein n=1 Tax=Pedobacter rhizosphaerae TaxID=390241 RepID=UPI001113DF4F|nr:hypothetical protein [Pedobacter rhizosphaerae]